MPDLGFMELPTGRAGPMRVHHFHKAVSTLEFFQHSFSARGNDEESCAMRFTRNSLFVLLTISGLCFFLSAQQTAPSVASSTVVPRHVNFFNKALDERGNSISGTTAPTLRSTKISKVALRCGWKRRTSVRTRTATTPRSWVPVSPTGCPRSYSLPVKPAGWV
jgi:hypothetical protein